MNVSHIINPHVAVEFIDEIPRLASGKALRRMLGEKK